jgi:uncharacterized FlaG/YvyC family protein
MQINFSTQVPEYNPKIAEISGIKEDFQLQAKGSSFEAKPKFEAQPESDSKTEDSDKLRDLQNALGEHDLTLKFRQDEETNQLIVELVDSKTGVAIRQMPSEVSVKLTAAFAKLQGQLVDEHI